MEKGLTGLANLGNTCFMNSCMQVLSHTHELNDFLNDSDYKNKLSAFHNKDYLLDSKLLIEWDNLRKLIWEENRIISPGGFLKAVHYIAKEKNREIFTGFAQNDLPEFLLFIIESFHNGMRREVEMVIKGEIKNEKDKLAIKCYEMMKNMYSKEYSEILDIFYGIHVSVIFQGDKLISVTPEPYFMIDLPIIPKETMCIYDCFEKYCHPEVLDGDNKIYDEETKTKIVANKRILFWNLPNILVVDLKRFTFDGKKIQYPIDIELDNLNLSNFVNGYNNNSYIYELYGVCNHSGGVLGGHYTASIKTKNNKWYLFNDTNVTPIEFDGKNNTSGYCLFYRKKNISETTD
tara:strand:- start:1172 stop:2212 length:1041 start_codon:yes stop_codon:yes gene_type:complete